MAPATGAVTPGAEILERKFAEAIAQHEAGNLDAARAVYEELRNALGPNPDILHLLGTLCFQQGAAFKGARLIRLAVLQRPDAGSYYDHFGSAVRSMGNLPLAAAAYRNACISNPALGSAFLNAAIVALETSDPELALKCVRRAVSLMPENSDAWLRLGAALHINDAYSDALDALHQARSRAPGSIEIYFHQQIAFLALDNVDAANTAAKQGILLDPSRHEIYTKLRGGDLSSRSKWPGIMPQRLATIVKPASPRTWEFLAAQHYSAMNYAGVAAAARRGALLTPEKVGPYNSLATATHHLGQFEASIRISRYGLAISPRYGDIGFNLSLSAFSIGQVAEGWRYWPSRLDMAKAALRFSLPPHWDPDSVAPDHLLVASEQGIGDDIVYLSCLPDLLEDVRRVTVETDARLFPLLARSFPGLNLIEKQLRPGPKGETAHDYRRAQDEHHFSHSLISGDLPALYRQGRRASTPRAGYLKTDEDMRAEWQKRLRGLGPPPFLGVCWRSGSLITDHRKINYLSIEELIAEIPTEAFTLVNLQYGDAHEELRHLQASAGIAVHDFPDLDQTTELDRVAALMSCLDLITAPGTAALALACSVGVPAIGLQKSYFLYGDGWDAMFPNLYPVKPPSAPTIVPDRPQRMGEAIRYFLKHGALPIREH
tara:strand:+ start:1 stop:1974 length:1974 start_codon:yes stop_codon:yes gene_type:complete